MVIALQIQTFVLWSKMSAIAALTTRRASLPLHISRARCCSFVAPVSEINKCSSQYYFRGSIGATRQNLSVLHMSYSSSAASYSQSEKGFGKDADQFPNDSWKIVDVPLVFVP